MMAERIYITGAPGCGVTTLGAALATHLGAVHIDTDDHYWVPTDPPYQVKRPAAERVERIRQAQAQSRRWVVSGTIEAWGQELIAKADLILFIEAPTDIRMERLRQRERSRFGEALMTGGAMYETHRDFIEWAADYELGTRPGRSRPRHEGWLTRVSMPVIRLDGTRPVHELVAQVAGRLSP